MKHTCGEVLGLHLCCPVSVEQDIKWVENTENACTIRSDDYSRNYVRVVSKGFDSVRTIVRLEVMVKLIVAIQWLREL